MIARIGFWKKRHYLNKMTLRELVAAYFQYYAIQAYIVAGIAGGSVAVLYFESWPPIIYSMAAALFAYPLIWYVLHRYILHGKFLFKWKLTAKVWKRIHYDHHQDPHDLEILFGALYTTMPTILMITIPIGWALGGLPAAGAAAAMGMYMTCFYEFCHCIEHLSYKPKNSFLKRMKLRHMEHHFHDEDGNFGITNFGWDQLFGTYYRREDRPVKSETVYNLGYTESEARIYPWVAEASGGLGPDTPRERRNNA